ncbi:MAG TPA: hypothetical protein PKV56_09915 [Burkholderiaceae bacterium]|nr:hypothetical protein [Burkholderiaceae bacterium]
MNQNKHLLESNAVDKSPFSSATLRWLTLALLLLVLSVAWLKPLDERARAETEAGLKRALVTYAVARTINGIVSVVQESTVSLQPGGLGVTLAPAQFLDPVNDLVEQFASVMLAVCVSFGIQLMLLNIGGSTAVNVALTLVVFLWLAARWREWTAPRLLSALVVGLVFLRFAVPLLAIASETTYRYVLADEYSAAQQKVEAFAEGARNTSATDSLSLAPDQAGAQTLWERIKKLPDSVDIEAKLRRTQERFESVKSWLDRTVEHVVRLMALFALQTVFLPLLFLWALVRLSSIAIGANRASRMAS